MIASRAKYSKKTAATQGVVLLNRKRKGDLTIKLDLSPSPPPTSSIVLVVPQLALGRLVDGGAIVIFLNWLMWPG
jgi:hypothetical protein